MQERDATDRLWQLRAGPPWWCTAAGIALALAVWVGSHWSGAAGGSPRNGAAATVVHDARLLDLPVAWAQSVSASQSAQAAGRDGPAGRQAPPGGGAQPGDEVLAAAVRARVVSDSSLIAATAALPPDNSGPVTTPSGVPDEQEDLRRAIRVEVARGGGGEQPPTVEVTIHCRQSSADRALLLANTLAGQYAESLRAAWRGARLEEYESARLAAEAADERLAQCAERLEAALRSAASRQAPPGGPTPDRVTDSAAAPRPVSPAEPGGSSLGGRTSPAAPRSLPPAGVAPGTSPAQTPKSPAATVPSAPTPLLADNPEWLDLARRIDQATRRRDAMLEHRTPSHPAVVNLEAEIESLRARWAATPRWIPARRPVDTRLGPPAALGPSTPSELPPAPTAAPTLLPPPTAEPALPTLLEPTEGAATEHCPRNRRAHRPALGDHAGALDGTGLPRGADAAPRQATFVAPAADAAPPPGDERSASTSAPVVPVDRPGSLPQPGWFAKPAPALAGDPSEDFESLRAEMSRVEAARALAAARQQAAWKRLAEEPRLEIRSATVSRLDTPGDRHGLRSAVAAVLAGLALGLGLWWLSIAAAIEPVLVSVEEIESFLGLPALGPIACASLATVDPRYGNVGAAGSADPIAVPVASSSARMRWIAAGLAALVIAPASALVGLGLW